MDAQEPRLGPPDPAPSNRGRVSVVEGVPGETRRDDDAPARWPWVLVGLFLAIAAAGMVFVVANGESAVDQAPPIIAFAMFGIVASLVLSRDRGNRIGWILMATPLFVSFAFLAGELLTWMLTRGDDGVFTQFVAIVNYLGWILGVFPIVFFFPLLFPNGAIPSRRWRAYLWFVTATWIAALISVALGTPSLSGSDDALAIANPLYVPAVDRFSIPDPLFLLLFVAILAGGIASLVYRFRRSVGVERQQIKWVVYGLIVAFVPITIGNGISNPFLNQIVTSIGYIAFPISVGIAILRLHLYDLDVVVRKTVVYGVLAAAITAIYIGVVAGIPLLVGGTTGEAPLLTFGATLLLVVAFQPLRDRARKLANRLVYGRRASPYEVMSVFSERIGETYGEDDILLRMATVVGEGIGAADVGVWLRVGEDLRMVAAWPDPVDDDAASIPLDPSAVSIGGADATYLVEHGSEVLGALSVTKPLSDPISPADDKLLSDLTSQAGLALRNLSLTADLRSTIDQLRSAQRRIVSAQDHERRQLERNIHDGAQQQLVALTVKARLARGLADRDPAQVAEMLRQIEEESRSALEDLRDLARGIYPPLLADKGLAAALEAQARKAAIPVSLTVAPEVGRYPQEIEAAVYFCVLEALQNVAKYAGPSSAEVTLRYEGGTLVFEVRDDGSGFDPSAVSHGSGLQGMEDRLAAADATMEVKSSPGFGTRVIGRIPTAHA